MIEIAPYFEDAVTSFSRWLSSNFRPARTSAQLQVVDDDKLQEVVRSWISRMSLNELDDRGESLLPVYVVNCPKLHVLPKKLLEYKLRWCDKWAYDVSTLYISKTKIY